MGNKCETLSANEVIDIYNGVYEEGEKQGYDFNAEVKERYPHISDKDIARIVDEARMHYYFKKNPCWASTMNGDMPITAFSDIQWILLACKDIVERLGISSATGYKENGVAATYDRAHISEALWSMFPCDVCVIE